MSANKSQRICNKWHITQNLFSIQCLHLPSNIHPRTSRRTLCCTGLQSNFEFVYLGISEITTVFLFLAWRFVFTPQTNHPPLNNQSLAGQTSTAQKILCIVLLWFSLFFLQEDSVLMCWRWSSQTATVLEAEAKFTSLCCHRCRSASSVVMVTLVMREGVLMGPEGQAHFLWAGVKQTTPQK